MFALLQKYLYGEAEVNIVETDFNENYVEELLIYKDLKLKNREEMKKIKDDFKKECTIMRKTAKNDAKQEIENEIKKMNMVRVTNYIGI